MTRHLISATLTDEAFECYQHWSAKRQGSAKLSESILLAFGRLNAVEAIENYHQNKLPNLFRNILSKMDRSQWFRMMIDDRELIIRFIGGVSVSRDYKVPWRPDEDALGDFWDTYKQEFKEGHQ
mgnify:CR=1 FL=1|tara:strand:+ start:3109 stop:3480 length:372 start_codon:yes stop_codon:yes gene_type:complete